jgi:dTDP-4-amino-4,6-dideoxygalactose transaminase
VRLLRSRREPPYRHRIVGTTRLDAIRATILSHKLTRLEERNRARRRIAARLRDQLADAAIVTPAPPARDGDHVYHQFVIRTPQRDALKERLAHRGIASAIH